MGRTACTEPQCLYKGNLYLYLMLFCYKGTKLYIFSYYSFFSKRFIAQKVYRACTRTSYRNVPLTNFNKYLHRDTSKTEVNMNMSVNNSSE